MRTFSAYVERDPETKLYVGTVPGICGAHTQAKTLDELRDNLKEVLELCLEEYSGSLEICHTLTRVCRAGACPGLR